MELYNVFAKQLSGHDMDGDIQLSGHSTREQDKDRDTYKQINRLIDDQSIKVLFRQQRPCSTR